MTPRAAAALVSPPDPATLDAMLTRLKLTAIRDQLDKVAHSTLLGNGNRVTIELAEALAPRVPVDRPRFLFASDGAAGVEIDRYDLTLGTPPHARILASSAAPPTPCGKPGVLWLSGIQLARGGPPSSTSTLRRNRAR